MAAKKNPVYNGIKNPYTFYVYGIQSGDGGIRTHVPLTGGKAISSRSRYGLFDTSPYVLYN